MEAPFFPIINRQQIFITQQYQIIQQVSMPPFAPIMDLKFIFTTPFFGIMQQQIRLLLGGLKILQVDLKQKTRSSRG